MVLKKSGKQLDSAPKTSNKGGYNKINNVPKEEQRREKSKMETVQRRE